MSLAHQIVPHAAAPTEMAFHPLADLFPLMADAEFAGLVEDIRQHGQLEMIVTLGGKILDGRNRYRACKAIGITPKTVEWSGVGSAQAFVVSHNLHRRHLNETQRALVAAKLANLKVGGDRRSQDFRGSKETLKIDEAAALMNVSRASVVRAKKVLGEGTNEEIEAIENGDASLTNIVDGLRAKASPQERRSKWENPNADRVETQRANARLWGLLRDALDNLTNLPLPTDVARIARGLDRSKLTDTKLLPALQWLTEFSDAWTSPDAEANPRGKNHSPRKAKADHRQEGAEGSAP